MAVSNGARNGLLRTPYQVQERLIRREYPARSREEVSMSGFFYNLVPFAIGAVAVVLVLGLFNMMRGGSPNTSQKLMRLRVLLQFIAIIVVMTAIWLMGR
jgi:hypoxia induced protein